MTISSRHNYDNLNFCLNYKSAKENVLIESHQIHGCNKLLSRF